MFELFEHTADVGLRIRAATLHELFAEAGAALFTLLAEDLQAIEPRQQVQFDLQGRALDELMVDYLSRLLRCFEVDHLLLRNFEVQVEGTSLRATVAGEPFDPARHALNQEVKAITYHRLAVRPDDFGWLAEIIVDI